MSLTSVASPSSRAQVMVSFLSTEAFTTAVSKREDVDMDPALITAMVSVNGVSTG